MKQHFDRENAIRTDRIAHYEEIMDRIIRITKLDGITPGVYASVLPELKELEDYYTSPEWQEDYAADEAGLLPEGLKRGVLSQDGISDLLDRFRDLKTHPTHAEQLVQLFFDQKQTLDLFLERGAIAKAQYDKSLDELTEKLQIDKLTE
jgi:hypothetical protein